MPALVATRFNADMKAKYQALVAAGKPPKVAITAVMRKFIILANTRLYANRTWVLKTRLKVGKPAVRGWIATALRASR